MFLDLISIHAPRVGSDARLLSIRRRLQNFNPRSPRGERHLRYMDDFLVIEFQSTLPAWGATHAIRRIAVDGDISIHAPRVGSDAHARLTRPSGHSYFNPRSPRGERLQPLCPILSHLYFNPRSPRGERHWPIWASRIAGSYFNPRSPRGERLSMTKLSHALRYFNPRSPRGERRGHLLHGLWQPSISIHAPRVGSDAFCLHVFEQ